MKKIKTLKLIIALLLLINIGQVAFFLLSPRFIGNRPFPPKVAIQERFDLNDAQMSLFIESRDKHRMQVRKLNKTLEDLSLSYYSSLNAAQQSTLLDSITATTKAIYVQTHHHFEEMRAICGADQLPKMDGFIRDLIHRKDRKVPPKPTRKERG